MLEARRTGAGIPLKLFNHPDAAQEAGVSTKRNFRLRMGAIGLAALAAVGPGAAAARAQSSQIVSRLPASTIGYVEWHGSSALEASAQENHLIQLMADPAMAPVWLQMAAGFQQRQQASKMPPVLSIPDVLSLLQNPAVFGVIELPRAADAPDPAKPPARMAVFVVYDATGKTALVQKWETATETRGPHPPVITHFDFDGTSVEERSRARGRSYLAMAGDYFVATDRKSTIEQLITRFAGAAAPADSVTQRPEYAQVKKFVEDGAVLDYFARMPDLHDLTPEKSKNPAAANIAAGLHLNKVHAMGGSVSFTGPAVRMRGAVLGDTTPPGLFDLTGASGTTFRTEAIVGNAPAFSVSRLNIAAMYRLFYAAIVPNLPQQQASSVAVMQGAVQGYLGMSIPQALELFTGEIASASSFASDGTEERVFAATIQQPESVLRILRALLGSMTLAEDTNGDTTTLDLAVPYHDPVTGLLRRKMYYVAVAPHMLLTAPRKDMLRGALAGLSAPGAGAVPAKGVFADPQLAQLRARMPEKLSGIGVADISEIPWGPLFAKLASNAEEARQREAQQSAQPAAENGHTAHPLDFSWLQLVDPNVIPKHLHIAVSGWWKDADGVYFDSYLQ